MREQRVFLKYGVYGALVRRQHGNIRAVQKNFSFVRHFESRNHAQRGGFAAPGRTEQRYEFAFAHVEIDIVDNRCAVVRFRYAGKLYDFV